MEDNAEPRHPQPPPSRRPRDLAISLLVLLVPMLVLVGGYQLLGGRSEPVPVDQSSQIVSARQAGMQVREPSGLEPGWVPVSAAFRDEADGATLRLGFVTPDGDPVQVVQSTVAAGPLLAAELAEDAAPSGTVEVAGDRWQRYPMSSAETALVWRDGGLTVLVVGPAAEPELADLAAAMR